MGNVWLAAQEAGALEGWLLGAAPPPRAPLCVPHFVRAGLVVQGDSWVVAAAKLAAHWTG